MGRPELTTDGRRAVDGLGREEYGLEESVEYGA